MSSINTNVSAMQALQSLNKTNADLETTQSRISTGYKVADAKDNAAIWSVAQVMRTDVSGFEAISEQLSLGESTVAVARNGAETIADLSEQIKERVVAAQGDNVDREKIQADIDQLVGQVQSVVDAAQFNGANLLKDSTGSATFDVLSSLDRASDQTVTSSEISVAQQNLSTEAADSSVNYGGAAGDGSGTAYTITAEDGTYAQGDLKSVTVTYDLDDGSGNVTTKTVSVDLSAATSDGTVASTLAGSELGTDFGDSAGFAGGVLTLDDTSAGNATVREVSFTGNEAGLHSMEQMNVTTAERAQHALGAMEGFIQQAIDASASFGSAEMRIETQSNFVSKLTDSLTAGVGALVDADMTAESAKLNALQVQQQLGTQALSIANQSPQALLSLFR